MLTKAQWDLVYLCWAIALGSCITTGFTLRRLFALRRGRLSSGKHHATTSPWPVQGCSLQSMGTTAGLAVKRALDVVLAAGLLVIFAPLLRAPRW